jgi:hypothetical protein
MTKKVNRVVDRHSSVFTGESLRGHGHENEIKLRGLSMTTLLATIAEPKVKKDATPAPKFYGELSVGPEIKALMGHLDMSELNMRAMVAYGIEEEELKEVLLESMTSELHQTYLLATPQRLAKEFRTEQNTDGSWCVVDGLNEIRADNLANEMIASAVCGLFDNPCTASTDFPMDPNAVLPDQNQ